MHQPIKIAIIGSTGTFGTVVTQYFLSLPQRFDVALIARQASKVQSLYPGIQCHTVEDYSTDTYGLTAALHGVEVLLSFLNPMAAPTADPFLFRAASAANVRLFIPSEYTLDVIHPAAVEAATERAGLMADRLRSARQLNEIAEESQNRTRCLTVCSAAFLDLDLLNGFIQFDLKARTAMLVDGGSHKATGCSMQFIARALEWIIRQDESFWPVEWYNRVHIAEVEYTALQLVEGLERLSGQTWTTNYVTSQDLLRRAEQAAAENNGVMLFLNEVLRLNFNGSGCCYFHDGLIFDNHEIHRDTLETILKDVFRQFEAR